MKYTESRRVKHNPRVPAFIYWGNDPSQSSATRSSSDRWDLTQDVWQWLIGKQQR